MSKIQVLILTMLFSVSVLFGAVAIRLTCLPRTPGETIAETSADTDGGVTVTTNEGLYEHFINSWQNGSAASLYDYVGDEIAGADRSGGFRVFARLLHARRRRAHRRRAYRQRDAGRRGHIYLRR